MGEAGHHARALRCGQAVLQLAPELLLLLRCRCMPAGGRAKRGCRTLRRAAAAQPAASGWWPLGGGRHGAGSIGGAAAS